MDPFEVFFWEPSLSPHKVDLARSLARSPQVSRLVYVAQTDLAEDRRRQGWSVENIEDIEIVIAPSREEARNLVEASAPDAVHVFSGVHWVPSIVEGLDRCVKLGRRFGLMSEPRVIDDLKTPLRLAHSWMTERPVRRSADFVLAIGRHGPTWFRLAGYDPSRIFPFGYFLPEPAPHPRPWTGPAVPTVTFLGRLEKTKGIQLFLDAIQRIRSPVAAHVAGAGAWAQQVEDFARTSTHPVTFHGVLPMADVPDLLQTSSIVVAPSTTTDDGWCAVVSEALMAGCAVVTTDRVGASICLTDGRLGRIVRPNGAALAGAVDAILGAELHVEPFRTFRSDWAKSSLTGSAGAKYMLDVLAHVYDGASRPRPFFEFANDAAP